MAVDGIKVDRAFTRAIGTDSVAVGILPQILAMADVLGLSVVAEGVETEVQSAYYGSSSGPMTGQGWLFGFPVSAREFEERWLLGRVAEKALIVSDPTPNFRFPAKQDSALALSGSRSDGTSCHFLLLEDVKTSGKHICGGCGLTDLLY